MCTLGITSPTQQTHSSGESNKKWVTQVIQRLPWLTESTQESYNSDIRLGKHLQVAVASCHRYLYTHTHVYSMQAVRQTGRQWGDRSRVHHTMLVMMDWSQCAGWNSSSSSRAWALREGLLVRVRQSVTVVVCVLLSSQALTEHWGNSVASPAQQAQPKLTTLPPRLEYLTADDLLSRLCTG